jgi:hypothetical protein
MYLSDLSLSSIPFKIVPLCSDTSIPVPLPLQERVLEVLEVLEAIPAASPPLCQSGYPLAAASSSGRRRSREGPNLVNKADEKV